MKEIIGVRFKKNRKIYHFSPNRIKFKNGDKVIVSTNFAKEYGEVVLENTKVDESKITKPLKKIIRKATAEDLENIEKLENDSKYAVNVCRRLVKKHRLNMKILDAEYSFDRRKLLINFTSEDRVDFRKLLKDLTSRLNTRIELRQLGVRDEARFMGGISSCGREFCCKKFLEDFQPVSIKMAKEQGLSLKPTKISGACGRLMCCLMYEQSSYAYMTKHMPKIGSYVSTESGNGYVTDINLLSGNLKVKLESKDNNNTDINVNVKDVKVLMKD